MSSTNGRSAFEPDTECRPWTEVRIDLPYGFITGKWWGPRDKQPIVALHGWQDNAGTFDTLCHMLPFNIPIYCIDLPGHGLSSHLPRGVLYHFAIETTRQLRQIFKNFGWKKLTIMGHSMGAAIAFQYAATFPDDVEKLISIDSLTIPITNADDFVTKSSNVFDKSIKYEEMFQDDDVTYSADDVLELMVTGHNGSITKESAKILLHRGTIQTESNKYRFSRDVRLRYLTNICYTMEIALAHARQVKAKILFLNATPSTKSAHRQESEKLIVEALREANRKVSVFNIPGTHHFHLNDADAIAELIEEFVQS